MKWYKHLAKSINNPFIKTLMYEFGSDAYLVFFGVLEVYADNYKPSERWQLCVKTRFLRDELLLSTSKLQKILEKISQNPDEEDRWEVNFNNDEVIIFIPKFRKLVDNYTKDNSTQTCKQLASDSQETFQPIRIKNKDKRIKIKEEEDNTPDGAFVLPKWIPEETWKSYIEVRNKKKAAKTVYALNLVIKELIKIQKQYGQNPIDVLNKSITSGWSDVYPLKDNNKTPITKPTNIAEFTDCKKCGAHRQVCDVDENGVCLGRCDDASN